ncbi:MAG TPA: Crp/Fnr family transcriptional regulator [Gaiellaceae bacterium]|nr:Crp/Fnr family transcriptional regulator [Gaiellaceae bacterium]
MEWRLLAGVPDDEIRELLQIARRRRFARNEVVFHRDDLGDSLHLIQKGRFSVQVMTPLGDVATIAVRGSGESFGEMALLADEPRRSATVTALEDAETFAVYRPEFEQLRARRPDIDRFLFRFLVGEVRMLNERLLEALYLPVDKRVRRRLVELASLYGTGSGETTIALTQEAIAELAGGNRTTVNQILRDEEKRGTIALERGKTRVLDVDELARRAR